ncbi:MAG: efflux RND transporter periplasmic adaptor subunit [Gammaproteobacteria bacterium]|nr:efflux RND transporter periplasmic adaptor subunit [Gammaproteobacteria bacterium]
MRYSGFAIAIIATGLLLSACSDDTSDTAKRKKKPHRVSTETLLPLNSVIERRFNALIVAPNTITISNQIAGTILKMPYRPGTPVKKSDVLVQIDDSLTRAEYKKALANLQKADQDLNRIKKLIPRQLASAEELSAASTDKKLAEADLTLKKIQLNRSLIKAPFDGVISQRFIEPGDTASINQPLLTLVDNQQLIARSAIPEALITMVSRDKPVKIKIPALSLTLEGKISTLYPTVDSNTQQVTVEARFEDSSTVLFPGQFAEMILSYQPQSSLLIPVNAVQYDTEGAWVYRLDTANKARKIRIKTGKNINNRIEVKSGLNAGDSVVTRGFVGLRAGKEVVADTAGNSSK